MGIIGLCSFIIFPAIDSNVALPYLIKQILPPVLKGIAMSGLLATLMSTADTALHVLSVSVCEDLILPFKKNLNESQKIKMVRLISVLMALFALSVALYFQDIFSIMIFAFSFWGPTILVPFIMILYGKIFKIKQLCIGVIIGLTTVFVWSFFFKEYTSLSGFIPGSLSNLLYFLLCNYKRKIYV
jgi:Na+/proline symporter